MILIGFTEQQIATEIDKDLPYIIRYTDHRDKHFRRLVLKAERFPVRYSFFYDTPLKNHWFISYLSNNKKEVGDNCQMTMACTFRDANGFPFGVMPFPLNDKRKIAFYPPHFFSRFRERMNLNEAGDDLIKRFFLYNSSYGFTERRTRLLGNSNVSVIEVFGSCKDGVCLGVKTRLGNVLFKTFITYEMTKGEQIETFADGEKFREEIFEK